MRKGKLGLGLLGALLASLLAVAVAFADPLLHEFVPDVAADEGALVVTSGASAPDAIVVGGEIVPAPSTRGGASSDERPMSARAGDSTANEEPGRRSPGFRPDRVTDLNGTIGYFNVFSPRIAPFKRVTSLDDVRVAADGTPTLAIAPSSRRRVVVEGVEVEVPGGPRDRFWGNVVLDFSAGPVVPLPSVSPESRILTLRVEPEVPLSIERDSADNYYARLVRPGADAPREVRLVFLTDSPRSYFGRRLPDRPLALRDPNVPELPPRLQADALTFAAERGVTLESGFADAVETLVGYFRGFEESAEPPRNTGDIYLDLARGRRGICRHRAYAFVITARALGIDARFVNNEAHAWAEIALPEGAGWLRVDLGGAAVGLRERGGADSPTYDPGVDDSLPRPASYEAAYEEARRLNSRPGGAGAGGTAANARRGGAAGGAAEDAQADGTSGAARSAPGAVTTADDRALARPGSEPARAADAAGISLPDAPARRPLELRLDRSEYEVFRGQQIEVTGAAVGEGGDASGLRVEALLSARGASREILLGVTVTRQEGRFRGVFGVPPDLAVGEYRLLVRTPGDARWLPARAR